MDAGLYIHIPFCVKKCSYCDFNSFGIGDSSSCTREYVERLAKEMEIRSKDLCEYEFSSVFVGGGTPSILSSEEIGVLFGAVHKNFRISEYAEITIESNPKTLSREKLAAIKVCGVNRLSIGLQSAERDVLKTLGRIHSYEDFLENYVQARSLGFDNINVDLMFAVPNQTFEDWKHTLDTVVELSPEHISAYSLIVEEGTPICKKIEGGELMEIDEDLDRKMYYGCVDFLEKSGYIQYEISNFAKPGFESRHNIKYWECTDYVGLGPGAHSYLNGIRYSNLCSLKDYYKKIDEGSLPVESTEELSQKQKIEEFMFMGMRMNRGVGKREFEKRFGESLESIYGDEIKRLESDGLVKIENREGEEFLSLTRKGIDISNTVFVEFLID